MSDLQKILLAAGLLLLVIACGNMANLLLARGLARQREFAVCLAVGGRRWNLVRVVVLEAFVCAMGGALLGALVSHWAFGHVTYRMTREVPGLGAMAVSLDWRIFGFCVAMAVVSSIVFALLPAWRSSNAAPAVALASAGSTTTGLHRSRFSALVVVEVALTMTLMLGASLLMKAVSAMRSTEFGYAARELVDVGVYLRRAPQSRGNAVGDSAALALRDRILAIPGAQAAATYGRGTPARNGVSAVLRVGATRWMYLPGYTAVAPEYLATMGVPIVAGRDFAAGDDAAGGAVIVNEAAAKVLWPGESAVGQRLFLGDAASGAPLLPVVGVARNTRELSTVMPRDDVAPQVLVVPPPGLVVLNRLRVRLEAEHSAEVVTSITTVVRQSLPLEATVAVTPLLDEFDDAIAAREFVAGLFVVFAGIALTLSAVGLYCLLAFVVTQRRREFAVRAALGAMPKDVARLMLQDGVIMVLSGTAVGAFVAMWLARELDAMLYSVFYTDVWSLLTAEVLVVGVALAACLVPAWRAARVEPVQTLRSV